MLTERSTNSNVVKFAATPIAKTFWELTFGGVQVVAEDYQVAELAKRYLLLNGLHAVDNDGKHHELKGLG